MTAYVILRRIEYGDEGPFWEEAGHRDARSARGAVWTFVNGSDEGGDFVAIPERSWKPMKVSVETKRSLRFG